MTADRNDVEELLGAYALDAVDADERAEIERYLEVNPRARDEVRQHQEVATMLAFSGAAAPADLWDRIAGQLEERAPSPGPELAKVLPMSSRRRWSSRIAPLAAAAAVAAAVTLGVVALTDRSPGGSAIEQAAADARDDRDSKVVALSAEDGVVGGEVVVDPDGHGYMLGKDLPEVGSDHTYQLWGVVNDEVISLGVFGNHPETEPFTVEGDLTKLVLTVEERGGVAVSEQPAAYAGDVA